MKKQNRLKVVWLCQFHNPFIAEKLGIDKGFETAPWMYPLAEIFRKYNATDIHIISPHRAIRKKTSFQTNNIHYHFIPYPLPATPVWIKKWLKKLQLDRVRERMSPYMITEYRWMKEEIGKTVADIDPDIVQLFGVVNGNYSSSIFQFKDRYPVLINVQGFINCSDETGPSVAYCKKNEIEILKNFDDFCVMYDDMKPFIERLNPNAHFFTYRIPIYKPKVQSLPEDQKVYDLIFFARITKEKGIEDFIEALPAIKQQMATVRVAVVGMTDDLYLKTLAIKADKLGVRETIDFIGPRETLDEVHQIAAASKISVLPTYQDVMPGTILESMQMGLPCVTYSVGGLITLGDAIKQVEKRNIQQLSDAIITLLKNDDARLALGEKARDYVEKRWGESSIHETMLNIYNKRLASLIERKKQPRQTFLPGFPNKKAPFR